MLRPWLRVQNKLRSAWPAGLLLVTSPKHSCGGKGVWRLRLGAWHTVSDPERVAGVLSVECAHLPAYLFWASVYLTAGNLGMTATLLFFEKDTGAALL